MNEIIINFVISSVANYFFWLMPPKKFSSETTLFVEKSKLFHRNIKPYLLNTVIPRISKSVDNSLAIYTYNNNKIKLPYIDLTSSSDIPIDVSSEISTTKDNNKIDDHFISWLRFDLNKTIYDNPTFRLQSISHNNKVTVSISSYFQTLSNSDRHYYNLINNYPLKWSKLKALYYNSGFTTRQWIRSLESIIRNKDFSSYSASIGCSVLTVLKDKDKYKYLVKVNSSEKNSMSDKHVIPSFMFQPVSSNHKDQALELKLKISVLREYGEELLNIDELMKAPLVNGLLSEIKNNKYLDEINTMLAVEQADLLITGFILDIFRLRPEFTLLLIIRDEKYIDKIQTNWEVESMEAIDLEDDNKYFELLTDNEQPLCASGLAALINGRNKAIDIQNNRLTNQLSRLASTHVFLK